LENLFRNAIEHGGSDVTIRIGPLKGDTGFYVSDDGVGISPDHREDVFESGYSTARNGTGLGLAIVEEVATAHEWDVRLVESTHGGTRFEFAETEIN
jgi:signal transduction histidine kinase